MISMDMKYTALYWALRFVEDDLDVHTKRYGKYKITINAEAQSVDYGPEIKVIGEIGEHLTRHKDFVILECIDRLLTKGYSPSEITINGNDGCPDIIVNNTAIECEQWGSDYQNKKLSFIPYEGYDVSILYTSRLVSGLLEYKNEIYAVGEAWTHGFFEDAVLPHSFIPHKEMPLALDNADGSLDDFEIYEDDVVSYRGRKSVVYVPEGITTIGASAFWNNTYIEKVVLPSTLQRLGGDCFYYCKKLKEVNIPCKVWIMGNDPFAGCPELEIDNQSPNFVLVDGVLFDSKMTNLIHYSPWKKEKEYQVPNGIICLGKHCFFACDSLEKIVVPSSVIRFENNPFSGCTQLSVENHSPYYHFIDGIIYNKFMTTIIGCLNGTQLDCLVVPESVTLISRNSFWNCKGIKKIVLTKNINRIGYNPFAGCENLVIESQNSIFRVESGIVYDHDMSHMLCATDIAVGESFTVPDSVRFINRGVFSGCTRLTAIDFNNVTYIDKSSFTNCVALAEIMVSDKVTYIGEWAFSYCTGMKKASISEKTFIDKNAFNECPAVITRRSNG